MSFRLSQIRFVPALLPTLAACCALALTLYLGHWQQQRAATKQVLQTEFDNRARSVPVVIGAATLDPQAMRYSRANASGEWLASGQIYLDNKFDNEAVGFHVITPLKIDGTNRYLLVNRGWVARGAKYPAPPLVAVPTGLASVEGVLMLPSSRFLELAQATIQGNVWQNLTIERYIAETGRDVLPLVLLAKTSDAPLKPVAERPDARAEKHIEYMLTWYALAFTIIVLWVTLNVKRQGIPSYESSISDGKIR